MFNKVFMHTHVPKCFQQNSIIRNYFYYLFFMLLTIFFHNSSPKCVHASRDFATMSCNQMAASIFFTLSMNIFSISSDTLLCENIKLINSYCFSLH